MTESVTRLEDVEAIRQVKAKYFRSLDTKDWEGFKSVFAEDAEIGPIDSGMTQELLDLRTEDQRAPVTSSGLDAFVERVARNIGPLVTTHHGHTSEVEVTSDTEAKAIWPMEDLLFWPNDGYRLRGTGHYWETYRKVDGDWKISSMKLTRLYISVEKVDVA